MASSILLLLLFSLLPPQIASSTLQLDLHHRFSDKVRSWGTSSALGSLQKETAEYYSSLAAHDRALLHRRGLAGSNPPNLTFADGNETTRISDFGFLHYAEVLLGTPKVSFLVALDTGSFLFWVPCDCHSCAPTYNEKLRLSFNVFNSSGSSTSRAVPCSSALCDLQTSCSNPTDTCPYRVEYVDNSSTSGVLLEDVMHFVSDDGRKKPVEARITFGCGQEQPKAGGTPNGLMGLGMKKISVPGTLAESGLTANSFSMCFSSDGSGRITFGDKGSPNQNTTPFVPNVPIYVVTATDVLVGNTPLNTGFKAFFDTGSSFTLLKDPIYTQLTTTFDRFLQMPRLDLGSGIPFEYCYQIRGDEVNVPTIELDMNGGKRFFVVDPALFLADSLSGKYVGFCLAVMKSSDINIIGQNFMTGYKLVFNVEELALGWMDFDCYNNVERNSSTPTTKKTMIRSPGAASDLLTGHALFFATILSLLPLLHLFGF